MFYEFDFRNSIYLSIAVANREPNRDNYTDANPEQPAPVAETLYDVEAGYRWNGDKLNASANYYYMYYRDQLVLTGAINDVGAAVMTNVPVSFRTGIELSGKYLINSKLKANANLTLSMNKIKDFTEFVDDWSNWGTQLENRLGTTDLAFSPAVTGGFGIDWEFAENLNLNLNGRYVSRQYIDNTSSSERVLDPYFVNNLRLSWSLKPRFTQGIILSVNVNNLTDTRYESNAWVYRYYYEGSYGKLDGYFPQAGINFNAGVVIKL